MWNANIVIRHSGNQMVESVGLIRSSPPPAPNPQSEALRSKAMILSRDPPQGGKEGVVAGLSKGREDGWNPAELGVVEVQLCEPAGQQGFRQRLSRLGCLQIDEIKVQRFQNGFQSFTGALFQQDGVRLCLQSAAQHSRTGRASQLLAFQRQAEEIWSVTTAEKEDKVSVIAGVRLVTETALFVAPSQSTTLGKNLLQDLLSGLDLVSAAALLVRLHHLRQGEAALSWRRRTHSVTASRERERTHSVTASREREREHTQSLHPEREREHTQSLHPERERNTLSHCIQRERENTLSHCIQRERTPPWGSRSTEVLQERLESHSFRSSSQEAAGGGVPPGEVLTDTGKKSWKLGAPIGQGGFGLLYLVQSWVKSHKLNVLGVPRYWGSGLHERGGKRFMVIDRLGTDLQKKFEECGRRFPRKLVLQLALRLLDILEFIHDHEYVHADIKASNLMLGHSDPDQVYLVDYGLAYRYAPDSVIKEYKEDPKRCHDGTIEFTSIDAHKGATACRRSDLEILCYCMVQWLCGRLPWEDKLQDPLYVRDCKIRSQENISEFMNQCFSSQDKPEEIQRFMEEVKSLGYQDKPPYEKLRSILQAGLKSIRAKDDGTLTFPAVSGAVSPAAKKTTKRKKDAAEEEENETDGQPIKKKRVAKKKEESRKNSWTKEGTQHWKVGDPKSRLVEMGTQTSPGLALRSRGRPKKTST
ncbi:hypothetical protein F7725_007491 [Dissostichus mawsoni]|uniref:non-specific serine/threonine protein kinase n=2 Tax=Nototheniidae TaxID=8206 RepID=A0A7J5Y7M2_DISMA|nr:hypothetical protein F7725_007491 [Dissostichus mawsoni]